MGEFDLINKISTLQKKLPSAVRQGIGDDCAVIDRGDAYELVTMDMLVQDDHFKLEWSTPFEIGWKAIQASISDIAAMGGIPKYAFVSLCLSKVVDEEWVMELYRGIKQSEQFSFSEIPVLGGDITHGSNVLLDVCLIGSVSKDTLVLRSGAKPGDLICVTGALGGSLAGLSYLRTGQSIDQSDEVIRYCLEKHKKPTSRLREGQILSRHASAMIDASDGLASEVRHIADKSSVGAVVYKNKIPLDSRVVEMGRRLGHDPYQWALSGGEDFELVFTLSKDHLPLLQSTCKNQIFVVGEIVHKKQGVILDVDGKKICMPMGYEHF